MSVNTPFLGVAAGAKVDEHGGSLELDWKTPSFRFEEQNWWLIGANSLSIFIGATCFFAFSTLGRALYFFDPWVGHVVTASSFIVAYVLMTLTTSAGVQPIFDYSNLILNSRFLSMGATFTRKSKRDSSGAIRQDVRVQGGQIGITETLIYLIALLAATFLANGLARLIAGDGLYAHAAKVVPPWSTSDRAFAIEWMVQTIVLFVGQQAVFHGASREYVGIFLGLATVGFQAIGYGVSGASFNTVYWLGVSVLGTGITEDNFGNPVVWWDNSTWVYPVSTVVAILTVILLGVALSYMKKFAMFGVDFKRNGSYASLMGERKEV